VKTDLRGGHNSFSFNTNFFKNWSPPMAYVLGYIFADGTIIDAKKSSRTCYLRIDSSDKQILQTIKSTLSSEHTIMETHIKQTTIRGKTYLPKPKYSLRIGNKTLYLDLLKFGLSPKKSLTMTLPDIPTQYFKYFLRGYFDGDGCLNLYQPHNRNKLTVKVIFTSGSQIFLQQISTRLHQQLSLKNHKANYNSHAFRLTYNQSSAIKILNHIYQNLLQAPYLNKKYQRFLAIFQ